jgi:RNA polymerase sigma factor (TIGR02999 family)
LDHENIEWRHRSHFFGLAAQAMRQILVDHARSRNYQKRGGEAERVSFDEAANFAEERAWELIALDEALQELAKFDLRKSRIVEMRYFGGLSGEETAEALGISTATVTRDWDVEFYATRVSKRLIAGNRSLTRAELHKLRGAIRRQAE